MQTDTTDDIFEDDIEVDDSDVVVLTAENRDELLAPGVKRFLFPAEEGKPRVAFYLKHASLARVNRYQAAHKSGSTSQQIKAACELIADSVVDATGERVWDEVAVKRMTRHRVDCFLHVQKCVSAYNGMSDSSETLQQLIEEEEKN